MNDKKSRSSLATTTFLFAAGILVAAVFSVGYGALKNISLLPSGQKAMVAGGNNVDLAGWVWSETIGWVSLNDSNTTGAPNPYGVAIDGTNRLTGGTGAFTGWAWSENIGWVSFDRAITGNPPNNDVGNGAGPIAQIDWSTGNVSGWARACAGTINGDCTGGDRTDGWDGWIYLSPANPSGVKLYTTTGKFSGFAWGSDVVGWLDFSNAVVILPGAPTVAITAISPVDYNTRTTVSWTTTGSVVSCSASGGQNTGPNDWMGLGSTLSHPAGSWQSLILQADASYEISCTGPGGTVTSSATAQVTVANVCGDGIISGLENCDPGNLPTGSEVTGLCSAIPGGNYAPDGNTYSCNDFSPRNLPTSCHNVTTACTHITQCNDTIDNDHDGKTDKFDPGCHTDGNASNGASYDKTRNSEFDIKKIAPI